MNILDERAAIMSTIIRWHHLTVLFLSILTLTAISEALAEETSDAEARLETIAEHDHWRRHLAEYQEAIDVGAPRVMAARANDLGRAFLADGHLDKAAMWLERSRSLAKDQRYVDIQSSATNNLGTIAVARSKLESALDLFSQAQELGEQAGEASLSAAAAINRARIFLDIEDREAARAALQDGQEALAASGNSYERAISLLSLGRQFERLDDVGAAFRAYNQAKEVADQLGERRLTSFALGYQAGLYAGQDRQDDAIDLTRQALFSAQMAGAVDALSRWHLQLGRLLARSGSVDKAIASYEKATANLVSLGNEEAFDLKEQPGSTGEPLAFTVYMELADLLLKRSAAKPDLVDKRRDLEQARSTIEELRASELDDYFQDECVSRLRALERPIDRLGSRTAALYPIVFADRIVLLLSLPDRLTQTSIPIKREVLTDRVDTMRRFLEKRTTHEYLDMAQALHDLLIAPLEPLLASANIDTLVFVPDGPLRTIPLAALHDGRDFLIDRYAVATVPGLSLLDPRPVSDIQISPLLNGLTQPVADFPALPHVEEELSIISNLFGGKVLRDEGFILPELRRSLAATPYNVVHIASHGQFSGNRDETFLLAYDGRLDLDRLEEFLSLSRFRDQPVELLTLSACRTAAGDDRAALGMAGIAVKAGARSALATLWFINDEASALLVADFYQQLGMTGGLSKAKALQAAQRSIKSDLRYRHPAYWAPFLLIGNWL